MINRIVRKQLNLYLKKCVHIFDKKNDYFMGWLQSITYNKGVFYKNLPYIYVKFQLDILYMDILSLLIILSNLNNSKINKLEYYYRLRKRYINACVSCIFIYLFVICGDVPNILILLFVRIIFIISANYILHEYSLERLCARFFAENRGAHINKRTQLIVLDSCINK